MSLAGAANANASRSAVSAEAVDLVQQGLLKVAETPIAPTLNDTALSADQRARIRLQMKATIAEYRRQLAERESARWKKRGVCTVVGFLCGFVIRKMGKPGKASVNSGFEVSDVSNDVEDAVRREITRREDTRRRREEIDLDRAENEQSRRRKHRPRRPRVIVKLLPRNFKALPSPR